MISVFDLFKLANGRVGDGSEYFWEFPGTDAWQITLLDAECRLAAEFVYRLTTFEVVQIAVLSDKCITPVQWISEEVADAFWAEGKKNGYDLNIAWDDVKFYTISDEQEILTLLTDLFADIAEIENERLHD